MEKQSPNSMSLAFVGGLYADYLRDPSSVPEDWREYFETNASLDPEFSRRPQLGPSFEPPSVFGVSMQRGGHPAGGHAQESAAPTPKRSPQPALHLVRPDEGPKGSGYERSNGSFARAGSAVSDAAVQQDRVDALVRAYRVRGHMIAQ